MILFHISKWLNIIPESIQSVNSVCLPQPPLLSTLFQGSPQSCPQFWGPHQHWAWQLLLRKACWLPGQGTTWGLHVHWHCSHGPSMATSQSNSPVAVLPSQKVRPVWAQLFPTFSRKTTSRTSSTFLVPQMTSLWQGTVTSIKCDLWRSDTSEKQTICFLELYIQR